MCMVSSIPLEIFQISERDGKIQRKRRNTPYGTDSFVDHIVLWHCSKYFQLLSAFHMRISVRFYDIIWMRKAFKVFDSHMWMRNVPFVSSKMRSLTSLIKVWRWWFITVVRFPSMQAMCLKTTNFQCLQIHIVYYVRCFHDCIYTKAHR